ncbi:hypothetical protein SDC9_84962 [bioreactor metagenome]|uniref:Uncharacterized protein n=1 Tax=bioreactor metagenome TaxID=1076179 RepID=A0A644ZI08_9ZZZZ
MAWLAVAHPRGADERARSITGSGCDLDHLARARILLQSHVRGHGLGSRRVGDRPGRRLPAARMDDAASALEHPARPHLACRFRPAHRRRPVVGHHRRRHQHRRHHPGRGRCHRALALQEESAARAFSGLVAVVGCGRHRCTAARLRAGPSQGSSLCLARQGQSREGTGEQDQPDDGRYQGQQGQDEPNSAGVGWHQHGEPGDNPHDARRPAEHAMPPQGPREQQGAGGAEDIADAESAAVVHGEQELPGRQQRRLLGGVSGSRVLRTQHPHGERCLARHNEQQDAEQAEHDPERGRGGGRSPQHQEQRQVERHHQQVVESEQQVEVQQTQDRVVPEEFKVAQHGRGRRAEQEDRSLHGDKAGHNDRTDGRKPEHRPPGQHR